MLPEKKYFRRLKSGVFKFGEKYVNFILNKIVDHICHWTCGPVLYLVKAEFVQFLKA
jgi:hypothetical protein